MFGWFAKKSAPSTHVRPPAPPSGGGDIEFHGLSDWWLHEFTEADRDLIRRTYSPLGNPDYAIDRGNVTANMQSVASFASGVAGWFSKEDTRHIGYKFLAKAEEYSTTDIPAMTIHFAMQGRCQFFYRWRDVDDFALEEAIKACERGIAVSKEAAAAFKKSWGSVDVGHYCFRQLAIIEEKRGNFTRAFDLCVQAEADGWQGDWDKRKDRLTKKLARSQ